MPAVEGFQRETGTGSEGHPGSSWGSFSDSSVATTLAGSAGPLPATQTSSSDHKQPEGPFGGHGGAPQQCFATLDLRGMSLGTPRTPAPQDHQASPPNPGQASSRLPRRRPRFPGAKAGAWVRGVAGWTGGALEGARRRQGGARLEQAVPEAAALHRPRATFLRLPRAPPGPQPRAPRSRDARGTLGVPPRPAQLPLPGLALMAPPLLLAPPAARAPSLGARAAPRPGSTTPRPGSTTREGAARPGSETHCAGSEPMRGAGSWRGGVGGGTTRAHSTPAPSLPPAAPRPLGLASCTGFDLRRKSQCAFGSLCFFLFLCWFLAWHVLFWIFFFQIVLILLVILAHNHSLCIISHNICPHLEHH